MSNSKQEAAAREKERELDKEQKLRKESRRNSVLPKDQTDTLDDSDFFSRSSTSGFGSDLSKRETLQLLGELSWTNLTFTDIVPPWFCVGGRILLLLFWVKGHLARWCQMTLKQSSSCIKGFQCLSFYDFSVRIWAGQTKTIIIVRRRGLFRQQPTQNRAGMKAIFAV